MVRKASVEYFLERRANLVSSNRKACILTPSLAHSQTPLAVKFQIMSQLLKIRMLANQCHLNAHGFKLRK